MDVSNRAGNSTNPELEATDSPQAGHDLLDALVALTGLPGEMVSNEVSGILESSGHSPATLTLDELRTAMLAYLESMAGQFEQEGEGEIPSAPIAPISES